MEQDNITSAADEELVALAKKGETRAYDQLVRRYTPKVYTLVYNMLSNRQDAEDLVQEIFVKAYRALRRFRGQASFFTWLYRIAVNHTLNFIKSSQRRGNSVSLEDANFGIETDPAYLSLKTRISPFREVSLKELQERLNAALQSLSEKHRVVVVMHDIQGIPHQEIAKMLRCSPGTVRSRLFYARKQLQHELRDLV